MQSLSNTAISNIQSSPTGPNVQFQVPELGIVGLIGENGYINFGKRFNNFLLQWGNINVSTIVNYTNGIPDEVKDEISLPLATTETYVGTATHRGAGLTMCIISRLDRTSIGIRMGIHGHKAVELPWSTRYIVISRI